MEEWLWMCTLPGFYRNDFGRLLQYFGSPEELYKAERKQICILPFLNEKQKELLMQHQNEDPKEIRNKLVKKRIKFISCQEEGYPAKLLQMPDFPFGLFYRGELPAETEKCVAVVGARMCTNYGRNMAAEIAKELAGHQVSVISGMAYGIDGIAQSVCLEKGGKSYAVTGCGVDICYPKEHMALYDQLERTGGIISEYPPGTSVRPFHFPMRNRLISALSDCIIVVEAKRKSGSLITADFALEQGKDVMAVPGRSTDPLSEGCNHLISQGAEILTSMEAMKQSLGIEDEIVKKKKKNNITLASSENMVYICLDFRPKSLSKIVEETDMPPEKVMSILTELQMKGLVEEISKNYYVLKKQM